MSEQNKAVTQRFYDEVFNVGNVELVDELFSSDFADHEEFPGISPDRSGVKQWVTAMRTAFPDARMDVKDMIAEGDKVVARTTMSGTQQGEFVGMPATGKSMSVTTVDIVRLVDGKLVEHWGATDTAGMMEQLGHLPPSS